MVMKDPTTRRSSATKGAYASSDGETVFYYLHVHPLKTFKSDICGIFIFPPMGTCQGIEA
ncbi:hypothetical protein RUM43_005422 [Polyplax serrata]|uniref:Uncharacterized protein n=1 Tax=Polyplax serrata TaxID=468196 RepID=A0AAN8PWV2_POLSC